MGNRTFLMIKPDAVRNGSVGIILDMVTQNGFKIEALRMVCMQRSEAEQLYRMHRSEPFFERLMDYVTSGAVVVAVLERDRAVAELRKLVGDTDPAKAAGGTLRHIFGRNKTFNAVHAADSDLNAVREAALFFYGPDYVGTSCDYQEQYVH